MNRGFWLFCYIALVSFYLLPCFEALIDKPVVKLLDWLERLSKRLASDE